MKESDRHIKIIEWSEEDQCYIRSYPGTFYGGCHGNDEQEVFEGVSRIVEEIVEIYIKERKPLPPSTSGKDYANIMQDVA